MAGKTIRQEVRFKASAKALYDAILDPKKHAAFSGSEATGSMKVGGKFTAYDGYIWGTNTKLEPGKRIVQRWTCSDFPEGHYTEVTFEFHEQKGVTKLLFVQTDVPEENYEEIAKGWKEFYWEPLKEMFG